MASTETIKYPAWLHSGMTSTFNSSFQADAPRRTTDTYRTATASIPLAQGELISIEPASLSANGAWERGLKYKTRSGILVRSKIETLIADSDPVSPSVARASCTMSNNFGSRPSLVIWIFQIAWRSA